MLGSDQTGARLRCTISRDALWRSQLKVMAAHRVESANTPRKDRFCCFAKVICDGSNRPNIKPIYEPIFDVISSLVANL